MDLQNLTGKMLTDSIRQKAQGLLVIFLPLTVLALLAGILLVIRLRIAGAVIGTVLIAIPLRLQHGSAATAKIFSFRTDG